MIDVYQTVAAASSAEVKIERSRFVGNIVPLDSRETAQLRYEELRARFHDATHNCFAWRIGIENQIESKYSDDGEPSGTAGRPILDAINSAQLTKVLVVVTRYFGGVKLGTGGLARAYREAAETTIAAATIVERSIVQRFEICFAHDDTSAVMKSLSDFDVKPEQTVYSDLVTILGSIRLSRYAAFAASLIERTHGRCELLKLGVTD